MTNINAEFSRLPPQPPDAQELTAELRRRLESVAEEVRQLDVPDAVGTALELTTLRNTIASPLYFYEELPQLDATLLVTLGKLPDLCRYALSAELRQAIKTLRRILLSDRRRIDPDPRRQSLSLDVCIRQLRLIEHRSDLLRARSELQEAQRLLSVIPQDHPELPKLREHHDLLKLYCETQEAYCSSVQREMQQLQSSLRG